MQEINMKCKICDEEIYYKNGAWIHKYSYPHAAIPNEEKADPFMHRR